jgi:ADP-ribosylglycohydrolase
MYGAILGDIAGSRIEFSKPSGFNPETAPLFTSMCRYTDDTVLTVATKYAILHGIPYARAYGMFGRKYRYVGYGTYFAKWLDEHSEKGYGSFGNGAAMRVSFIGLHYDSLEKVEKEAEISAMCTHNHPEGIKAAVSTAGGVFLAKNGASKKEIARYFEKFGYFVHIPLRDLRHFVRFDATAKGTIPVAVRCFLESDSWESCIRNVFSLKCDSDTVACIAGGIADQFYGGTEQDEKRILKDFLIRPDKTGNFDKYLYQCAVEEDAGEPE